MSSIRRSWKAGIAVKLPCHEEAQANHLERLCEKREVPKPAPCPGIQLRHQTHEWGNRLRHASQLNLQKTPAPPIADCSCLRDHKWEPPSSSEPLSPVHPQNCKSGINYGFKPLSFGLVCSAEIVEKLVPRCWVLPKKQKQKQKPPKQGLRHENVPVDSESCPFHVLSSKCCPDRLKGTVPAWQKPASVYLLNFYSL